MFSSGTVARDFLHSNPSNQLKSKHGSADGEFLKGREFVGSDYYSNHHQQQQQQGSGLVRYRSAPSSFLAAILDSNTDNNSSSGDESDAFFSALMEGDLNPKSNRISCGVKQEDGVDGYDNGIGSYSVGMERDGNGNRSNMLVRQSSSPAGFFSDYGIMGEVGDYRVHMNTENSSSSGGLSSSMNLSPAPSSSSRFMPSIPETGNENVVVGASNPENARLKNGDNVDGREYEAVFEDGSWNESHYNNLKRNRDGDQKMYSDFNGLENQNGETRKKNNGLVSHFSMTKTSSEMAMVENYLHFQSETTVPCQIRAKRGFATHPRSIAERNRRTKISKNMKKLQDLFPNMDKQTNTADMLDLAVEYIKDLQNKVQTLKDTSTRCVCSIKPRQTSPIA